MVCSYLGNVASLPFHRTLWSIRDLCRGLRSEEEALSPRCIQYLSRLGPIIGGQVLSFVPGIRGDFLDTDDRFLARLRLFRRSSELELELELDPELESESSGDSGSSSELDEEYFFRFEFFGFF